MSLNWDAFLNAESLNIPYDQWSDLTTLSTAPPASEMPKSTTSDTSGCTPEDVINFDTLLNGPSVDPYFVDDSLFVSNEYLLDDLYTLPPLGNIAGVGRSTTESSPEPVSASKLSTPHNSELLLAQFDQSPEIQSSLMQAMQRANSFPNPSYESMFPNNLNTGFVEDLAFPDEPNLSASDTTKPLSEKSRPAQNTRAKRNKNKPDILSACWTSPLCPNHDTEGPPPNPSTCGGGCAPFLFANDDALPIINDLSTEPQEITAADGIVEIQPRRKKRSDSETSVTELPGRRFPSTNTTNSPITLIQRLKSEASEDSPVKESSPVTDDKPNARRRLPHNQVERKYRESLNTQLESLRRVVPSLQQGHGCDGADIEDLPTPSKPSKAIILASATSHIKQIEREKKSLADENALLRAKVKSLQGLINCDTCTLMQYVMNLKINQAK